MELRLLVSLAALGAALSAPHDSGSCGSSFDPLETGDPEAPLPDNGPDHLLANNAIRAAFFFENPEERLAFYLSPRDYDGAVLNAWVVAKEIQDTENWVQTYESAQRENAAKHRKRLVSLYMAAHPSDTLPIAFMKPSPGFKLWLQRRADSLRYGNEDKATSLDLFRESSSSTLSRLYVATAVFQLFLVWHCQFVVLTMPLPMQTVLLQVVEGSPLGLLTQQEMRLECGGGGSGGGGAAACSSTQPCSPMRSPRRTLTSW